MGHSFRQLELGSPKELAETSLRPLAHLELEDQVVSTAVMMCLADRVEARQEDPRHADPRPGKFPRVISLGNRLFCDDENGYLRFRWGSTHFYRGYFQDYRSFLARPEQAAEIAVRGGRSNLYVVQTDLKQFYDRVSPDVLSAKLSALSSPDDDPDFFRFATEQLAWTWHPQDKDLAVGYGQQEPRFDFERIALPQGLASAGFFANIVLLEVDEVLRGAIGKRVVPRFPAAVLEDACRYVDDMRLVFSVEGGSPDPESLKSAVVNWLENHLLSSVPGLLISESKTRIAALEGDRNPLVRQSRRMERMQHAISGGFSVDEGVEIVQSLIGLVRTQERFNSPSEDDGFRRFSPVPDVPDATVARFSAGRFRSTFRSLRPLLEPNLDHENTLVAEEDSDDSPLPVAPGSPWTRKELDEEARAFSLTLIDSWIKDPSNVRLLRIGLDLWPSPDVLGWLLRVLRPYTEAPGHSSAASHVACHCLSEMLRAGATETGYVADEEMLPDDVNISEYRRLLLGEALRLVSDGTVGVPWYLRQQALLYIAVAGPKRLPPLASREDLSRGYRPLLQFLVGGRASSQMTDSEFGLEAVLAWSAFAAPERAESLALRGLSAGRLAEIMRLSPDFGAALSANRPELLEAVPGRLREDLGLLGASMGHGAATLGEAVFSPTLSGHLRNEMGLLQLAKGLLPLLEQRQSEVITPSMVIITWSAREPRTMVRFSIRSSDNPSDGSLYQPPTWSTQAERWRFQLGYLLRFVLAASADFTRSARQYSRGHPTGWNYRPADSHWYQRHHGFFNGQSAFGQDWLPISDWTERLLFGLLRWPGARSPVGFPTMLTVAGAQRLVKSRLNDLALMQRGNDCAFVLPIRAPSPLPSATVRPFRLAVAQTVMPRGSDFSLTDLTLDDTGLRRAHQRHLRATLTAIRAMSQLRGTHNASSHLDLLVFPELSVHPSDIRHLMNFARSQKTIIVAGMTYERVVAGDALVNSALWVIPTWSKSLGLQVRTLRQGKGNLAPQEAADFGSVVRGFRPAQLLVGYEWSNNTADRPMWLTAAICYDATDLGLASGLRDQSDVLIIPALNRDVQTFDQMASALHYHMYQLVVIANNGQFGGSNAYAPYAERFDSQVFHMHGNNEASIAFLEIPDVEHFLRRRSPPPLAPSRPPSSPKPKAFKTPPAGLR